MNNITITLTTEQIAMLNKMLTPYVELYASINNQYKANASSNKQSMTQQEIESRR
ncbi:MAG: hypothetical protein MJZ03_03355 [archaeon]|nr:hypothetical protein [archaeon]